MPSPRQYTSNADRQKAYRTRQEATRLEQLAAKNLPPLPTVASIPGTARWTALLETARAALQTAQDEMQQYFDERSEQWQESDRAEAMQGNIDDIGSILDALADVTLGA